MGLLNDHKMFRKRFTITNGTNPVAVIARLAAKIAAEDANTAIYVREYQRGNFTSRADYISYLANRLEYEFKKAGLK